MAKEAPLQLSLHIGAVIRKYRKALGVSQEDFAEMVQMHRTYYSTIELGKKNVRIRTLERICRKLKVPTWRVMREVDALASGTALDDESGADQPPHAAERKETLTRRVRKKQRSRG